MRTLQVCLVIVIFLTGGCSTTPQVGDLVPQGTSDEIASGGTHRLIVSSLDLSGISFQSGFGGPSVGNRTGDTFCKPAPVTAAAQRELAKFGIKLTHLTDELQLGGFSTGDNPQSACGAPVQVNTRAASQAYNNGHGSFVVQFMHPAGSGYQWEFAVTTPQTRHFKTHVETLARRGASTEGTSPYIKYYDHSRWGPIAIMIFDLGTKETGSMVFQTSMGYIMAVSTMNLFPTPFPAESYLFELSYAMERII